MHPPALLVMTKPALPGRVKTRLAATLGPGAAARLHAAFFEDLVERLSSGPWELRTYWALEPGEALPARGFRQRGADLGARLFHAFSEQAGRPFAAAIGSDHPELDGGTVRAAFAALEAGADVALGPARDGGYYLVALRPDEVRRELFEGIDWSTDRVFAQTLANCARLGLAVARLEVGEDVDTPADLERLAARLAARPGSCRRTEELLAELGFPRRPEVACAS